MGCRYSLLSILIFILLGCKSDQGDRIQDTIPPSEKLKTNAPEGNFSSEKAKLIENSQLEFEEDEYGEEFQEMVYEPFDAELVLSRFGLVNFLPERSFAVLLSTELEEGYLLSQDQLQLGDETFEVYTLSSSETDLIYFYYSSDVISTIEIIHSSAVPENMLGPGNSFGDLRMTYEDPVAYGSEITARVLVPIDEISFILDFNWSIAEPIDLEDDTEILSIQF